MGKSDQPRQLLIWILIGLFFLAVILKVALLSVEAFPFNADEAIVGLMARHILEGNWPVFFYGQTYMGSLDATLIALGFTIFGSEVFVIRTIQILLYLGTIILAVNLSARIFRSQLAGLVTGLLLAVPTVNITLYTTVSLGGYGEALLIGALLLLLAIQIDEKPDNTKNYLLWGFFSGLGFWAFGLTIAYILPTSVIVVRSLIKSRRSRWWVQGALRCPAVRPSRVPLRAVADQHRGLAGVHHRRPGADHPRPGPHPPGRDPGLPAGVQQVFLS